MEAHPPDATTRLVVLAGGAGIVLMVAGAMENITTLWAAGAVLVVFAVANWPCQFKAKPPVIDSPEEDERPRAIRPEPAGGHSGAISPDDTDGLVRQMVAQHRYALLLRPQIAASLNQTQFTQAIEALQARMALVPDGEVTLGQVDENPDDQPSGEDEHGRSAPCRTLRVKRFFLDRHPVTNREFFEFVAAGGYEQMSLWDESVLPAVLDFVDRTGEPGPRFWKEGCFLEGTDDHPVIGVCWHEAAAYARWVGKRLPSDAEWVKAGAWPVPLANHGRIQRRYPWGDDMDRRRANLWGSGPGRIVGVNEFAGGISLGGVQQLIGNVWEWTAADFHGGDHPLGKLTFKTPMKTIRGGAFDTYFDNQATCQFASGETTLARKRNIGFRLAIGVCDLVLDHSVTSCDTSAATTPSDALQKQAVPGVHGNAEPAVEPPKPPNNHAKTAAAEGFPNEQDISPGEEVRA